MPCCQSSLQYSFWNSSASALSPKMVPTRCATADLASTRKPRHCASMSSLPCATAGTCHNPQACVRPAARLVQVALPAICSAGSCAHGRACLERLRQHSVQMLSKLGRLVVAAEVVVYDCAQQRIAKVALQVALLRLLRTQCMPWNQPWACTSAEQGLLARAQHSSGRAPGTLA